MPDSGASHHWAARLYQRWLVVDSSTLEVPGMNCFQRTRTSPVLRVSGSTKTYWISTASIFGSVILSRAVPTLRWLSWSSLRS